MYSYWAPLTKNPCRPFLQPISSLGSGFRASGAKKSCLLGGWLDRRSTRGKRTPQIVRGKGREARCEERPNQRVKARVGWNWIRSNDSFQLTFVRYPWNKPWETCRYPKICIFSSSNFYWKESFWIRILRFVSTHFWGEKEDRETRNWMNLNYFSARWEDWSEEDGWECWRLKSQEWYRTNGAR